MIRDLLTSIGIVALVGTFWIFCVFQAMGVPIQQPTIPTIAICDPYEQGQAGNEMFYYLLKLPLHELDDQAYYMENIRPAFLGIREGLENHYNISEDLLPPKKIIYGCKEA